MGQLKQVCTVTHGSQTVTFGGVNIASRINARYIFMVDGELVPYTIAANAVFDGLHTVATLTGAYQGVTNANAVGVVVTDMTYPNEIPLIAQGDVGTASVFSNAMYRIQELITGGAGSGGDVTGPLTSVDNAVARFDSTTGKLLQESVVIIDDVGNVSGTRSIEVNPDGVGAYSYHMMGRSVPNIAVPYLQPTIDNTPLAFDLFPKGSPADYNGIGVCWMDICSSDANANDPDYECLRMGIMSNGDSFIGHAKGGAGSVRSLRLQRDGGYVGIGINQTPQYLLTLNSSEAAPCIALQSSGVDKFFFGHATAADHFFTGAVSGDHALRGQGGKIHLGSYGASYYNLPAMTINPATGVTSATSGRVDFNGDSIRVVTTKTPAGDSASGVQGQICWDSSYVYVCVATNTWKRAPLSTFSTAGVVIGNHIVTTYTLDVSDAFKYLRFDNTSPITLTIPSYINAEIPIGATFHIRQVGAGQVTFLPQTGDVTILTPETLSLRKAGSIASLTKVGTNVWEIYGDLQPL